MDPIGFSGRSLGLEWGDSGKSAHHVYLVKCICAHPSPPRWKQIKRVVFYIEYEGGFFPEEAIDGMGECVFYDDLQLASVDFGISIAQMKLPDEDFKQVLESLYWEAAQKLAAYLEELVPGEDTAGFLRVMRDALDRYRAAPIEEIYRVGGNPAEPL